MRTLISIQMNCVPCPVFDFVVRHFAGDSRAKLHFTDSINKGILSRRRRGTPAIYRQTFVPVVGSRGMATFVESTVGNESNRA